MSTSIIDYIFRELAITYLDRRDLAHVIPDDLRGDSVHDDDDGDVPIFEAEETASERVIESARPEPVLAHPRSAHLKSATAPTPTAVAPAPANRIAQMPAGSLSDRIRIAKQKGYEGDPCPVCQSLTLVRSGACAKCDTCGETSGCS